MLYKSDCENAHQPIHLCILGLVLLLNICIYIDIYAFRRQFSSKDGTGTKAIFKEPTIFVYKMAALLDN